MRDIGAVWLDERRCRFRVWAPHSDRVRLHVAEPENWFADLVAGTQGYHQVTLNNPVPGIRYRYQLSGGHEFPDPASSFQPEGVHGPSELIPAGFSWTDKDWYGIPLETYVIYEIHTGTFTHDGTFDAIIPHLDTLIDLGVTAIELMPIAQFPGDRNWGYDGVYPFAVQNSYGGPLRLKHFVNTCHKRRLAVILDVVYNHLGPEGNYLRKFGPYFTDRYRTPWGQAVNYDDAHCDDVRHYFLQNALYWITEFHVDALRLDAVHAIMDNSAETFLEELSSAVHERGTRLNRRVYVIAESELNNTRLIRPQELGGYGLDAQWNDDFHHSLHTLLTKESEGYYIDFGGFQHMAQAFSEGFVYSGRYSVNRRRRHGNSSREIPPVKFIVYAQNHDQVGNRMLGERLSVLVSFERLKLAAATVILSPFVPLLFMGDEYAEPSPFRYFVSHSDTELIDAVRRGREEEFSHFNWRGSPPDPQSEETFVQSKLQHGLKENGHHRILLDFHRELLRLRRTLAALQYLSKDQMDVFSLEDERVLIVRRWDGTNELLMVLNFSDRFFDLFGRLPIGTWRKRLDAADERWMGPGSRVPGTLTTATVKVEVNPTSVLLLEHEVED